MRYLPLLMLCALLAACAQQPGTLSAGPEGRKADSAAIDRARLHTELAFGYYVRQQYAVALQEISDALSADDRYSQAYDASGLVHAALHEDAKAEKAFKRAIEIDGQNSRAHNNYGSFLCERDRYDEALKQFNAALSNPLYSTPELALVNAGLCSMSKGDLTQAEHYLQRALQRAPDGSGALVAMADLRYRQGRTLAVRELLKRLAAIGPLDAKALWLGVRAERRLGDKAAEASYTARLNNRFPNSQEAQWLLAGRYDQPEGNR
jgi:type IV pilus assembly protein PilF